MPPLPDTTSKPVDTPPPGWVKQPGLFAVMMEIPAEHEDDFTRWYNEEHIHDLLSRPGWRSVRRLKALNEQKFIALWEVEDVRFQQRPDRDTRPQSAWTQRMNAYRTSVERTPWIELTVQVRSPSDGA